MNAEGGGTSEHDRDRLLAENSSDVVFLMAPDNTYDWVSPSAEAVFGWRPEELIGTDTSVYVPADDMVRVEAARRRGEDGTPWVEEVRFRCKSGDLLWVSVRSRTLVDGPFAGSRVVSVRDVHEQAAVRAALAESEMRFRLLADHASDVVTMSDPSRVLQWVSPTVTATLGWNPAEMVGRPLSDFAHPDDARSSQTDRDQLYGDHDAPNVSYEFLVRLHTKAGEWRWMSGRATRVRTADGTFVGVVNGLRDVDDLVRARQSAEHSEELLRVALDALRDGVLRLRLDGRIEHANRVIADLAHTTPDALVGRSMEELGFTPNEAAHLEAQLRRVLTTGEPHVFELEAEQSAGRRWYEVSVAPVLSHDGTILQVIAVSRDVTDRLLAERELTRRATRDALTGLANRASLLDEVDRAVKSSRRSGNTTAVLMLDLDHFKYVNDSLGHAIGDQLLLAAAHRLESSVRSHDLVARLGGDEFVVVMRDLDDAADAMRQAQRVVEQFRQPLNAGGQELYATASIGVAIAADESDPADLLREADTALYVAKDEGRDRVSLFNDDLRAAVTARLTIEAHLRPALERGEFEVWYQPEVDLATGEPVAMEALLRWRRPDGELMTADRFIEAVEDTGMVVGIGAWVLGKACQQAALWNGARRSHPITIRVNMSARQLAEPGLLDTVDEALEASGLDPRLLCLEITESTLLRESPMTRANLAGVRHRGVGMAIDDFGIGFASLAYLRDFAVDLIKIDRSFITNLASDDHDRRLVAGIVALARRLGVEVTAEGVETAEQVRLLGELGCTRLQGFLFAPALPPNEATAVLGRRLN